MNRTSVGAETQRFVPVSSEAPGEGSASGPGVSRLTFRLSSSDKLLISTAAGYAGQSVQEFALAALVQRARRVLRRRGHPEQDEG